MTKWLAYALTHGGRRMYVTEIDDAGNALTMSPHPEDAYRFDDKSAALKAIRYERDGGRMKIEV